MSLYDKAWEKMTSLWMKPKYSRSTKFLQVCGTLIMFNFLLHRTVFQHLDSPMEGVSSKNERRKKWKHSRRQRVILISGALQSGLDKLNSDISQWSKAYKLGIWSWSVPDIAQYNYTRDKGFDPLVDSLVYGLSHNLEMGPRFNDAQREVADYFLKEYRAAFVAEWMKDKSILVGSEKFYSVVDDQGGDRIIDSLINILPWNHPKFSLSGSKEDITALICYRPSRLKHLVAIWRSSVDSEEVSFSKWLSSTDQIGDIDALGIAEEFLKRGISVIIIDVEDVIKNHQDLGHFISCNILDVPCNKNLIVGLEHFNSTISELDMSYKSHLIDVDDATLNKIERILQLYDCNFQHYRNHREVELFNGSLERFFSVCASRQDTGNAESVASRVDLRRKIVQIVQN